MVKLSLAEINDVFNQRVKSIVEPNGEDYWQTPAETIMSLEGDCEDYCIAKMYSMIEAGYPKEEINIYCVRLKGEYHQRPKGELINHAFVVYNGWVLDNYVKEIVKLDDRIDMKETYAIINPTLPNSYRQWNQMLLRRDEDLDKKLIINFFSLDIR